VFFVLGVCHGFQEVGVAGEATHIFWGTGPDGPDKARICGAGDARLVDRVLDVT
jgi:hypothetical protein